MAEDLVLLERYRGAVHEFQLRQYRVDSIRQELVAAESAAQRALATMKDVDEELKGRINRTGPYYFDPLTSQMVYRG